MPSPADLASPVSVGALVVVTCAAETPETVTVNVPKLLSALACFCTIVAMSATGFALIVLAADEAVVPAGRVTE